MGKRIQLAGAPARMRKIPYGEGQDVTTRAQRGRAGGNLARYGNEMPVCTNQRAG